MTYPERRFSVRRRPIWMPAVSYYVLAVALAAAFFFLIWGVLHDSGVENPWMTAGISSSFIMIGSVLFRELVMRRNRERYLRSETAFAEGRTIADIPGYGYAGKLTVEQNAALLREIRKRSDAANVLSKFSEAHREVFELCAEYLNLIEDELSRMNAGSPRLEPFLKGRTKAGEAHRFHMLRWAEIEATGLTLKAQTADAAEVRSASAMQALSVVDTALGTYPNERALVDSRALLAELSVSIDAGDSVARAEAAVERGDISAAVRHYREALQILGRDDRRSPERESAAEQIRSQLEKLRPNE